MVVKGLILTNLLMVLVVHGATTNSENGQSIHISPAYPVRFKGDSMVMEIKTFDGFIDNYIFKWATVSFNDDNPKNISDHAIDSSIKAAIFNYNLDKIKKSGNFNATVYTYSDVDFVGQTFITAVNEPRHTDTVMMENSKDKLYCLDHDDLGSNLITIWYKNGQMIQELTSTKPLEISAEKGIERNNYTCVIATQRSIQHYGSIENATEAGATVSVRKPVGVLNITKVHATTGKYNVTASVQSSSELNIQIMDSNGQLLASGFPSVHAVTNESHVTVMVEDSYDVIFNTNHTLQDDTEIEVDKPGSHGLIVGIIITIIVIGAIVIVLFCFWRRKMYCWEDRRDNKEINLNQTIVPLMPDNGQPNGRNP